MARINLDHEERLLSLRQRKIDRAVKKRLISRDFGGYCAALAQIRTEAAYATHYAYFNNPELARENLENAQAVYETMPRVKKMEYSPTFPEQETLESVEKYYREAVAVFQRKAAELEGRVSR